MRHKSGYRGILFMLLCIVIAGCAGEAKGGKTVSPGIIAKYHVGNLEEISPSSPLWQQAHETLVDLLPQDVTDPKLIQTGDSIRVRAMCNNNRMALRIIWEDSTRDTTDFGDQFSDAVAVQIPPSPGGEVPDPTMGQPGKAVHIHLWRASNERDSEEVEWNLKQTFPNAAVDHYPFEAARESERERMTRKYAAALAADNPQTTGRTRRVNDLIAQGFGTLTHLPLQASDGWSEWENGRWTVVISRPLAVPEWPGGEGFEVGNNTFVAFAVWDGGQKQTGSRKVRTAWIPLTLEDKP